MRHRRASRHRSVTVKRCIPDPVGIFDAQAREAADGLGDREPQAGRPLLLCALIEALEEVRGIERPRGPAVLHAQAVRRKRHHDLTPRVAVHEGVFEQVAHQTRRQRGVHVHRQAPLLVHRKVHAARGVDLREVLGHAPGKGVEIDLPGLGELPVVDLREQQQ